ncbi:LysR substrate-binding domain-containing protein [Notoacmeibacter sp. MSK16QG-6]|uniref:LysR substrate-binding domain-containing protein n=1 Tax=Notoacmeibacter sp. MSK16QG-6 TaxID=2957982 RepID=UPI00209EB848|nr:LysR substrate-binding domain-containing protein [Notoacmeibacter sp. MSK16QG-6]MCP1198840.1 LysR substrate-binding domain-containing protein [Notoacmeibacter sp. MSK16QG-6]
MNELARIHLNALRAAETVGRTGSLKSAAAEIGVTPGAVSQHLIGLERQLGRRLFERSANGMQPTPFGARLLPQLTEGFSQLDQALAAARRRDDSVLTISVAPNFASKWLVPRLAQFSRLHSDIRVRVEATTILVDLNASDVDLAIRVGNGDYPGAASTFLAPQQVFPVCSPEYAKMLKEPADLKSVPILRDVNSVIPWQIWLDQFGMKEKDLPEGYTFTDGALCLEAAIAGQGVMLAWQFLAQDSIAAGRLVAPFPGWQPTGLAYWLLRSERRRPNAAMSVFSAWLQTEIETSFPA